MKKIPPVQIKREIRRVQQIEFFHYCMFLDLFYEYLHVQSRKLHVHVQSKIMYFYKIIYQSFIT